VLSTRFNTCPPYFKVESKITRDFAAQSSLFTYTDIYKNPNIKQGKKLVPDREGLKSLYY